MKKLDIDLQKLKNQYNIVGKNEALDTALMTAVQVAPTDLSILAPVMLPSFSTMKAPITRP